MDLTQIILVGCILGGAVLLQSTVGFGAGMFAISMMVLVGIPLSDAVAALLAAVTLQLAIGCWRYREHIPWRPTFSVTFWRYIGMPIGILTLAWITHFGQDRVKQVVGVVLLLVIAVQFFVRVEPQERVPRFWISLSGTLSGFMAGAIGMGGPPMVLWTMAHDWPSKQTRAFLWAAFLTTVPFNAALLYWKFGESVATAFCVGIAYAPILIVASLIGARLGDRLNRRRLRRTAYCLLITIAVASIIWPLF